MDTSSSRDLTGILCSEREFATVEEDSLNIGAPLKAIPGMPEVGNHRELVIE
jgi:hypothetical protein